MSDPFRIEGPAVISFSGGRTSAYMLRRILDAHDGALPPDVHAVFANTGREMPATLDFVAEVASRWNVPVTWLEFTARRHDGYREVSHNSASGGCDTTCSSISGFCGRKVRIMLSRPQAGAPACVWGWQSQP